MAERHQSRTQGEIGEILRGYYDKMLRLNSKDDVLYDYQKKLMWCANVGLLAGSAVGLVFGYLFLRAARMLKKTGPMDIPIYCGIPMAFFLWTGKASSAPRGFSVGFPAHPYILEQRRRVINQSCFYAP